MESLNRRNFIKKTSTFSAGIGAFSIIPSKVWANVVAPSDKINVGIIGCRSKGFGILKNHLEYDDVNCVAMCDVDENILNERAAEIREKHKQSPVLYKDFRKMLEQKDIDAVIIGTPDHWHCLNTVYSLQAGKHVYVEKPMANTIEECNIMVKAANYYNKIVQVGQQQRSQVLFRKAMELMDAGSIGTLRKVNMWANFGYGLGPKQLADESVPAGVDYNMWLGPAANRPFNRNHFHGSWRHYWNYGGGLMSDWGVHLIDMGLWAKDLVQAPTTVMTFATNNSPEIRQRDTFDTMSVVFPTKDYVITWDMNAGLQRGPWDMLYGMAFIGELGTIVCNRGKLNLYPEYDNDAKKEKTDAFEMKDQPEAHTLHVRNFLDCVKTGDKPNCPPEIGRAAALHAHIPNIAARIGEPLLIWDDKNNRFTNSERANSFIVPEYRAPWTLPKIG